MHIMATYKGQGIYTMYGAGVNILFFALGPSGEFILTWFKYVTCVKRWPYFLHEWKAVKKVLADIQTTESANKCIYSKIGHWGLGPVKSQRIKTQHDTNLTWQGLQCVVLSCLEADSVLPPCRLLLLVFLWRVCVRHKTWNGVFAVALCERVQQRSSGLLILLWPWRKRLSTIKQSNKLSPNTQRKFFHQRFPALSRDHTMNVYVWSLQMKRNGSSNKFTSGKVQTKAYTNKSWFSVVGSQTSVQVINWVCRQRKAFREAFAKE